MTHQPLPWEFDDRERLVDAKGNPIMFWDADNKVLIQQAVNAITYPPVSWGPVLSTDSQP